MPIDSLTKTNKTVTPIKIKNNQIISKSNKNSTSTDPNKRSLPTSPTTPTSQNAFTKKLKLFSNRYNVLVDLDDNDYGDNNDEQQSSRKPRTLPHIHP